MHRFGLAASLTVISVFLAGCAESDSPVYPRRGLNRAHSSYLDHGPTEAAAGS
jgi:hypothetical protein